jgi:hypothetical protein
MQMDFGALAAERCRTGYLATFSFIRRDWGEEMDGTTFLSYRQETRDPVSEVRNCFAYETVIREICELRWEDLGNEDILQVAHAYYYFSIQFRENLEIAIRLRPQDQRLRELHRGECNTDNLSPWPGVTAAGEKVDHDEFMKRLLGLQPLPCEEYVRGLGASYLARTRKVGDFARATSIASYEDGGLSRVFTAMLRAPQWRGPGQEAFRHFLAEHVRFDTEDDGGHGSLSRHLVPTDGILPLWAAFKDILVAATPRLSVSS